MRFFEDGPIIPDELLHARDEGRVVFFCGAGVSATEGLPSFIQLVEDVFDNLGVTSSSPAFKLFYVSEKIRLESDGAGAISADRIFGLLEEEFPSKTIETAVAQSLRPKKTPSLKAHNILLDLATTDTGFTQLVTTNFDCLFEECGRNIPVHQPPQLPNPSRPDDMHGIIHLHGKSTPDYQNSEQESFVLTSSEFGKAYLSEGWATSFIKKIIENYIVVFVGYTADDPPVQYLLEALKKSQNLSEKIYAFQPEGTNNTNQKWISKGVTAILYNEDQQHRSLWETLEAWSIRAKDPIEWYRDILKIAQASPRDLKPFQRGQIAHIISTTEGVRKFAEAEPPISSEWLYVFDANQRYGASKRTNRIFEKGGSVEDPFGLYCLDTDDIPEVNKTKSAFSYRKPPFGAWDAFEFNPRDLKTLGRNNYAVFRGSWSTIMPRLPSRLWAIRNWISSIAEQPATVWWAASLGGLNIEILDAIQLRLRTDDNISTGVYRAWSYLIESWERKKIDNHEDWFNLQDDIQSVGWNMTTVRRYGSSLRPYIVANESSGEGSPFQKQVGTFSFNKIINLKVEYPTTPDQIDIPSEWLPAALSILRKNLELALDFEYEASVYKIRDICSIIPDEGQNDSGFLRGEGLSGSILHFSELFTGLLKVDKNQAKKEYSLWTIEENPIFSLLRIWAAGNKTIISNHQFKKFIGSISDEDFWSTNNNRDILMTLRKRWNQQNIQTKQYLEQRILTGPIVKNDGEDESSYVERQAWNALNRINWLAKNNCRLTIDIEAETQVLQEIAPKWKIEYIEYAAESRHSTKRFNLNNLDKIDLNSLPLSDIVNSATRFIDDQTNSLNNYNPFSYLCENRGWKALAALRLSNSSGDFQQWAWRTFLNSSQRRNDPPKLMALIAERLAKLPAKVLLIIFGPATYWFETVSNTLAKNYPDSFNKLIKELIHVIGSQINSSSSESSATSLEPSQLVNALFSFPIDQDVKPKPNFPTLWISHANQLLNLPNNMRSISIEYFSRYLNWCFRIDSIWTEDNLLSILKNKNENEKNSFWKGTLRFQLPTRELFLLIKSNLLLQANKAETYEYEYLKRFSDFIYAGWITNNPKTKQPIISNLEMREYLLSTSEKIRLHILWKLGVQSRKKDQTKEPEATLRLIKFLKQVWPKHNSVKSSDVSARLVDLAFSNEKEFLELSTIIKPLISKYSGEHLSIPNLSRSKFEIINKYPLKSLELLFELLPDNAGAWPRNIKPIFDEIISADPDLKRHNLYVFLIRKWTARL